jgi:hypothetical protein
MNRVKITAKQYNTILLFEQKNRLKTNSIQINESFNNNTQLLEEGWREVLLGVAMLMGVGLSGPNAAVAQNALQNNTTISQIKATLEDETKLKELAQDLAEKGMKNPDSLMAKNAQNIVDKFNKLASEKDETYKVSNKVVTNLQSLSQELGKGYAIKKLDIGSDTIKGQTITKTITVKDTVEVTLGNDNTFITGGFTLSSEGVNSIKSTIDGIKNINGKVISANIESSTDAESVPKFRNEQDPTGNIELANRRTKSVTDLLQSVDSEIKITHREIPNNGSDVVSAKQFLTTANNKEELKQLRDKTSEFRYVKLTLVFEVEQKVSEETAPETVVKNYRAELVRVFDIDKVKPPGGGGIPITFGGKKIKCASSNKCFTF